MNFFERGFRKSAQDQLAAGQSAMPETETQEEEQDTAVTCVSDCNYSQNPEKRCMLKSVTFSMTNQGVFACGQYSPIQEPQMETQNVRN